MIYNPPEYEVLRAFVANRMPELNNEMGDLGRPAVRQVLNAVTGLDISGDDLIGPSCARYLDRLYEMNYAGQLREAELRGIEAIRQGRANDVEEQ